jgi:hypothetical protein
MIHKTRHASLLREELDEPKPDPTIEKSEPAVISPPEQGKAAAAADTTVLAPKQDNMPPPKLRGPRKAPRTARPTLLDVAVAGLCALVLSFLVMFLILSPERRHDMLNQGSPKHVVPEKPAL